MYLGKCYSKLHIADFMASNIFPMISSSPPPLDDCPEEDDDDDEFGNFTSANIPFDSSFDSPVTVEKFKSFKSGDNGVNFSDEIHKFNSCSNSVPPSPQDFVPKFSDENEDSKIGFIPIKSENDKSLLNNEVDSTSNEILVCKKLDITSQKCVPHVQNSSSDSEFINSVDSDAHTNSLFNCSIKNNTKDSNFTDFTEIQPEFNHCSESSLSVCDVSEGKEEKLNNCCGNSETPLSNVVCDESKIDISNFPTKSSADSDAPSFSNERRQSPDKFTSDFNSEFHESDPEEFDDFQQSEQKFSSYQPVSHLESAICKVYIENNGSSSEVMSELSFGKGQIENFHDFSDNECDDFQSYEEKVMLDKDTESIQTKSSEIFECDHFQDFQQSSVTEDVTDDFADFQDFNQTNSNTDDFADFTAAPFDSNKPPEPSEFSEFADFEDASSNVPSESSSCLASSSQRNIGTLSTVINAIFPLPDNLDEDSSNEPSSQILEQSNKSRRLWEKLHEVEQTPGLRFQWGVSHSFQQLLRSVNVDYHSILRTSSVPIFASGLSLLEPVKGLSNSVNHDLEDTNHTPKDPIPPVEFDWNSSGLVNPLDLGQAVSTLMDLSFLSSMETDTNISNNDHSFENELLKPSPALPCSENSSKTQILEQLLSKNVSSLPNSKISHRPSDLSDEAVRVLDQLPDLSFMQAKVLMFPISKT